MQRLTLFFSFTFLLAAGWFWLNASQEGPGLSMEAPASPNVTEAARIVFASLDQEQREAAFFPFDSTERKHWNYTPYPHSGVDWRHLSASQRDLVVDLLQSVLSEQGYVKTRAIMELENILRTLEDRPADDERRNPERYYLTFFGEPGQDAPWGWRFEGHHVSLNFTSVDRELAVTPTFFGTNPHRVPIGTQQGHRILDREEDMGREMMASLGPDQQAKARIAEEAPEDMYTANHPAVGLEGYQGIPYGELSDHQKGMLEDLIHLYLDNLEEDLANSFWQRIQDAGMEKVYFAWAGTLMPGEAHYYRLHGPTLLIEYDNWQNGANHVHTVLRDPTNDWGENLLEAHYEQADHH